MLHRFPMGLWKDSILPFSAGAVSMRLAGKFLALWTVSAAVLAGCSAQPAQGPAAGVAPGTAVAPGESQAPGGRGAAKSALPVVNPPNPGPYKTILLNGEEMMVGRFPVGPYGGAVVQSIIGSDPKVFNYWTATDTQSRDLSALMFRGLLQMDAYTGGLLPDLADSWKVDPDGVTYTARLRKGLRWSDGKPITADDVVFTWNTLVAGGYGNSSLRDTTTIEGKSPAVTAVDDLTVKFVTPRPFAPFERLIGLPVAPKHVIEPIIKQKNGRDLFQQLWAANCDPGTLVTDGPFVLSRYVPGQRVEFVPARNFYMVNRDGKHLPYLGRLVYQIVPDVNTNLLKFKAQEIDVTVVRARDVADLIGQQGPLNFKLYNLGQSNGSTFLMFNMNRRKSPDTHKPYVDPVKSAWFNDVNFRQAVNHAINRDNIVANYFKGIGFPSFTAEPPTSPFCNKELKGFPADVEYAMSLLAKSGFRKRDDGFLYDGRGHRVEFDMLAASGGTFFEALGNMIAGDLKNLGMKVNFQMLDFNIINDKTGNSLNWEACLMALSPGDPLEPNDGANVYKSDGRLHLFDQRLPDSTGKVAVTDARPWEKQLDELFDRGAETLDKAKRKQIYDQYQKIIYDQAPFIYLVSPMTIIGARNTLGNYDPTPLSQGLTNAMHNIEEIYKKK